MIPWLKPDLKAADLKKPTVIVLLLANLLPIYGVIFLKWEVFPIMFLFWTENVIIGVFNIFKMAVSNPASPGQWVAKLFMVPFFAIHCGIFTLVHGILIFVLFGGLALSDTDIPDLGAAWQIIKNYDLMWGFLSLLLSHGISFEVNYVRQAEYKQANLTSLMMQPYGRIVVLHLTIIFGGLLVAALGSPTAGLILLIVLKMVIDALAHLKLHFGRSAVVSINRFHRKLVRLLFGTAKLSQPLRSISLRNPLPW